MFKAVGTCVIEDRGSEALAEPVNEHCGRLAMASCGAPKGAKKMVVKDAAWTQSDITKILDDHHDLYNTKANILVSYLTRSQGLQENQVTVPLNSFSKLEEAQTQNFDEIKKIEQELQAKRVKDKLGAMMTAFVEAGLDLP